jgi:hypothetical protein
VSEECVWVALDAAVPVWIIRRRGSSKVGYRVHSLSVE